MNGDFQTVTKGDILFPVSRVLLRNGKPLDLTSYTVKWKMVSDAGTSITAATATGITKHPTYTFTADASTDLIASAAHFVKENDEIVVSNTGGSLPTGLSASTRYFAKEVTSNAFKLSATPGGQAINITGAGTGTHSYYIVGHVTYQMLSAEVNTAGTYWAWFQATDGTNTQHWPSIGRGLRIDVVEAA